MATVYSSDNGSMFRRAVAAIGLLAVTACATVQTGPYGIPVDLSGHPLSGGHRTPAGLLISARENASLSSDNFGVIVLTLENTTDDWIRIDRMQLGFGGAGRTAAVDVLAGEQLESWANAATVVETIRTENELMLWEGLSLVGEMGSLAAKNRKARTAGVAVAAGANLGAAMVATGLAARGLDTRYYPESHLLEVPFSIPPHLFTRRWLTLGTHTTPGTPCIEQMLLDYQTAHGDQERVWVMLRPEEDHTDWQRHTCPHRSPGSPG